MDRAIANAANWETKAYNASVIDSAHTKQLESSTLPAKQFGNICYQIHTSVRGSNAKADTMAASRKTARRGGHSGRRRDAAAIH